ncbi:MAG TPA: rhodanese-like domain-containing protein [Longimicrobiales bacterium]|nr:rhodanese-like domain-containing protein [Longimicrobiales bacterium]
MQDQQIPPVLHPAELSELVRLRPDIRLLDVRTPGEYESIHIHGAYNVPLDTLGEHGAEVRAHVEEPVVLICQAGGRARQAEDVLKQAGMPNLHVLDGGMNAWLGAGLAVRRGAQRISLERQVRILAGILVALGGLLAMTASAWFGLLPTLVGSGLVFAGVTDRCGMALVLARLPYNRPARCDVRAMVEALKTGAAPSVAWRRVDPSASCA